MTLQLFLVAQSTAEPTRTDTNLDMGNKKRQFPSYLGGKHAKQSQDQPTKKWKRYHESGPKSSLKGSVCEPTSSSPTIATAAETNVALSPPPTGNTTLRQIQIAHVEPPPGLSKSAKKRWRKKLRLQSAKAMEQGGNKPNAEAHMHEKHQNHARSSTDETLSRGHELRPSAVAVDPADSRLLRHVSSTKLLAPPRKHWVDDTFNRPDLCEAVELQATVHDERKKFNKLWPHEREVHSPPVATGLSPQTSAERRSPEPELTRDDVASREVAGQDRAEESGETVLSKSLSICVPLKEERSTSHESEGITTTEPVPSVSKTSAAFMSESGSSSDSSFESASSDEDEVQSVHESVHNAESDGKGSLTNVDSGFESQQATLCAARDSAIHSPYLHTSSGRTDYRLRSSTNPASGYLSHNGSGTCENSGGSNGSITLPLTFKYSTSRKASNVPTHYSTYDPREAFQRFSAFIEGNGSESSSDEESDSDIDDRANQAHYPVSADANEPKTARVHNTVEPCQAFSTMIIPDTQEESYIAETVEDIKPLSQTSSIVLNSQPDRQLLQCTNTRDVSSFQESEKPVNPASESIEIFKEEFEGTSGCGSVAVDDLSGVNHTQQCIVETEEHGPSISQDFETEDGDSQMLAVPERDITAESAQHSMEYRIQRTLGVLDDRPEDRVDATQQLESIAAHNSHTSSVEPFDPSEKLSFAAAEDPQSVEDKIVHDASDDESTESNIGEPNAPWPFSMPVIPSSEHDEEGSAIEILSQGISFPLEPPCVEELDRVESVDSEQELVENKYEESDLEEPERSELLRPALWSLDKGEIQMESSQGDPDIESDDAAFNETVTNRHVEIYSDEGESVPELELYSAEGHEAAVSLLDVQSRHLESGQELPGVQQPDSLSDNGREDHGRAPPETTSDPIISKRRPLVALQPEWLRIVDKRVQKQLMSEMVAASQSKASHTAIAEEELNLPGTPHIGSAGKTIIARAITQRESSPDDGEANVDTTSEKLPEHTHSPLGLNRMVTPTESTPINDASTESLLLEGMQRRTPDLETKPPFLDGSGGVGFGSVQNLETLATPTSYRFAEDDDDDKLGRNISELTQDILHTGLPPCLTEESQHSILKKLKSIPHHPNHGSCTSPVHRRPMLEVSIPKIVKDDFPIIVYTAQVRPEMQDVEGEGCQRSEETPSRQLIKESSSTLSDLGRTPTPPGFMRMGCDDSQRDLNGPTLKRKRQKKTRTTSKHFTPARKQMKSKSLDSDESLDSPSAQLSREIAAATQNLNAENPEVKQSGGGPKIARRSGSKRKSTGTKSEHFLPLELIDRVDLPSKLRHPAGISRKVAPPITSERFGIIQEKLWREPFWLLVAVTFLNKTGGKSAGPTFWRLKERFPNPQSLAAADEGELHDMIHHLGLQNQRSKRLISLSKAWISDPPVAGKSFKTLNYPRHADHTEHKDYKKGEAIEGDREYCKGALEIGHMPGCGPYAWDSWRIFCRDVLRDVAEDYNGKGAADGFQPEWQRVLPLDKELRATLRWMWLREGWIWSHDTGEKRKATEEEMEKAVRGEIDMPDDQERKFAAQAAGVDTPKNARIASSTEKPKKGKQIAGSKRKIKSTEAIEEQDSDYVDD